MLYLRVRNRRSYPAKMSGADAGANGRADQTQPDANAYSCPDKNNNGIINNKFR